MPETRRQSTPQQARHSIGSGGPGKRNSAQRAAGPREQRPSTRPRHRPAARRRLPTRRQPPQPPQMNQGAALPMTLRLTVEGERTEQLRRRGSRVAPNWQSGCLAERAAEPARRQLRVRRPAQCLQARRKRSGRRRTVGRPRAACWNGRAAEGRAARSQSSALPNSRSGAGSSPLGFPFFCALVAVQHVR